jgi:hypothetical protein
MKSFRQFILEARQTIASQTAKQMGLVASGHGDYYDQQGNLVAKTIDGKLKIFNGRDKKEQESNKKKEQTIRKPTIKEKPQPLQKKDNSQSETQGKAIVVVLGRFNPPGKAHENLIKFGATNAKSNQMDFKIYPSRIKDPNTNPLDPTTKIKYMQAMYPEYSDYIVDSADTNTIFDVLSSLYGDGYKNVKVVVGSDRVGEFQSLAHRGQGQDYEFDNIEVIPASVKDPDSDSGGSGSSAQLRAYVAQGNYNAFSANIPQSMKRAEKEQLFNALTKAMNLKENFELWQIAPELDLNGLRINYKNNNIFPIGMTVENVVTGLRGSVLRRGTNYVICLTNEGFMFKSWLSNLREIYEIGTCKYREALQRITPGQPIVPYTDVYVKETNPKKKININSRIAAKLK